MGETYDYNHWVALIWPEHEDDYGNFGEVLEATWNDGEDGLARLYVSLCPNIRLINGVEAWLRKKGIGFLGKGADK